MKEIWIEVSFDNNPMANEIVYTTEEAKKLIKTIEENGFEGYDEQLKNEWLEMGFRDNPVITARICG